MTTSAYSATDGASRRRNAEIQGQGQGQSQSLSNGNVRHIPGEPKNLSKAITKARPRESRSWIRRFKHRAVKHTWLVPLILILAFLSLYALNPTEGNIIHRFIFLSYAQPATETGVVQYGKGIWDVAFVFFYTIVLSFTREFIMQEILSPFARLCGIRSQRKQARFMEQMYSAIYFGCTGVAGLYVMSRTPVWYFRTTGMYEGFPHRTHEAAFKFYYLFEAAYWAQQALVMVLGLEERRKDFKELVAHHIVTLALIGLSYRFHFTYIGVAIYTTHDISDFFLAISKSFHYTGSELVIPFYALNVVAWIYLRHYLNLRVLYSLLTEFRTVGPYELNWETEQYKCWISNIITFALLAMLQSLNLFWLYCLGRSSWKFLSTGEKKDDRSDDSEPEENAQLQSNGPKQ
ncbi:hypothetical protein N7520_010665 [Penicillium odoratum]|uniref:uncharacterized protein n=1 Tax=Penicillium odoratum TaxID=1167516 RepID=UPI0025471036|nr:uncharacterized protein N7520_010665 [Penicillium odoratum]KAJ5745483.1 hypothetical protein N7520_010665 [Penicillium odoratum]